MKPYPTLASFYCFLLLLLFSLSCSRESRSDELSPAQEIEKQLTWELDATLKPLTGSNPNLPSTDLSVFDFLGEAKIVGMGEATNGTREFFQMKHRLFKYLVEKHGFRVLAFEYDFGACLILDEMLQTGQGSISNFMRQYMGFWTLRTEEVVELFQWMQDYNRNKPDDQKLHVVGADCQLLLYGIPQLVDMLRSYDPVYAQSVNNRLGAFAKFSLYPGATFANIQPLRDAILPKLNEIGRELTERSNAIAQATSTQYNQSIQHLFQTLVQAEIVQYGEGIHPENGTIFREKYLAENTSWIFEQYGNVKVALWSHNAHVANDNFYAYIYTYSLGGHLRNKYGNDYQIVGFSMSKGQLSAFNQGTQRIETMTLGTPLPSSTNYFFSLAKEKNFVVKLIDLKFKSYWQQRFVQPQSFLSVGSIFDSTQPNIFFAPIPLDEHFDVIVHFSQTSATKTL